MKKKSSMQMKKAPAKFNKQMKEAAAAGKLDKNPKFKKAVMESPATLKKSMATLKKSMAMLMKDDKAAAKMKKERSKLTGLARSFEKTFK